jgi:hypothetical protein
VVHPDPTIVATHGGTALCGYQKVSVGPSSIERMSYTGAVEELELLPAGPELASRLAAIGRVALSDQDLLRVMRARQRLVAYQQAQLLADMHALATRPGDVGLLPDPELERRDWAEVEIAFALGWSAVAAGVQLSLAHDMIARLPAVFAALQRGGIDMPRARVVCDAVVGLDEAVARRVVDEIIDEAPGLTTGQLRARLRRLVIAADPAAAAARAAEKVAGRRIEARLTDDSLGELHGYDLPPHRVAAAMERLTAIAVAARNCGDSRGVDRLRADAFLDLLIGDGVAAGGPITHDRFCARADHDHGHADQHVPDPWLRRAASGDGSPLGPTHAPPPHAPRGGCGALPAPRRGAVEVQVPLATLMGLSENPGELAGFGPVVADIARQVAAQQADATWRFSITNTLGEVIHHGTTRRRPTAATAAFVRARNRTCVAPGCRRAARSCDLDHTTAWADGGASDPGNVAPLCRRHHRFKHAPGTDLISFAPGVYGWTTPAGLQYVTRPEPFTDVEPHLRV